MDINQDERVQNLAEALSTLQINHQSEQDRSESIIAEINSMKTEITSLKLTLQDVTQRLLIFHQQLANVQNLPPPPPPPQVFADVAVMTHTSFSGNPKELNKFIYFIKDRLVEVESRFQSEKSKINWIQDLAIMASNVLDELAQLRNAASVRTPNYQPQLPPPPPAATPMDIDSITASSGFTFPLYRSICIKNKLCQRCHKAYDKAHITNRSCPNVEVSIKEKIDLYTRLSRGHPPVALAEVNLSSINPDAPVQSWDSVGVNSFADMLMYGSDEDGNIIDQGELFFSIASLSTSLPLPPKPSFLPPPNTDPSRLVIPIKLLLPGLPPVTAMALIDSGAGGSFINKTS
ncbi:hypothetical protein H4Q26_000568 [Puccinia striiformis f. sp. tritici PST-130]|nr:hypothetical protein H4Q26_000568 [Puccinia striiformis f. sp. tritici PST-130]